MAGLPLSLFPSHLPLSLSFSTHTQTDTQKLEYLILGTNIYPQIFVGFYLYVILVIWTDQTIQFLILGNKLMTLFSVHQGCHQYSRLIDLVLLV